MRWFPIVILAACSNKSEPPPEVPKPDPTVAAPAGSAAPAKTPPPVAAAYCFGPPLSATLTQFHADDKTALVCGDVPDPNGSDKQLSKCMSLDLASGAFSEVKNVIAPAPAPSDYKFDGGISQICKSGKCVKLDLPKLPVNDPPSQYTIHASADGKKLLAIGNELKGIAVLDAATGKRVKTIKFGGDPSTGSDCLEDAEYVGDTIYAMTSVCAGPGGSGHFLHDNGKEFASIPAETNVYGAEPLQVYDDVWAFAEFGGGSFTMWNVKTGKLVRDVTLTAPDPCDDCDLFGDGPMMTVATLIKTPGGKLLTLESAGISVVDPKTGEVGKLARFPVCPAPK